MEKYFFLLMMSACCFALTFSGASFAWAKEQNLIKLETSMGDIVIELDTKNAPLTSANFKTYVEDNFYDGTIFHRVIGHFMIQGGGFDTKMRQKDTREAITNEANNGLKNTKYTVAMARTQDPHSATAQFFINVADNDFLDFQSQSIRGWGYCVFGKVVQGMDVVDKIKAVPTQTKGGHEDVPKMPVVIYKAIVLDKLGS